MNLLRDLYILMSRPSRRQMHLKQDNCTSLENSLYIGFCFVYLLNKAYLPFTIKFHILLKVCNQAKWSHGMAAVPWVPFEVLGPCVSDTTESYLKKSSLPSHADVWHSHTHPSFDLRQTQTPSTFMATAVFPLLTFALSSMWETKWDSTCNQ